MKALLIVGIVLGALFLLLFLILMIRVDVVLGYHEDDGFAAYVRILGIPFGKKKKTALTQAKPSAQKKPKTEKSVNKEPLLRALGFSHLSDKETVKRRIKENGVSSLVTDTAVSVRRIFEKLWYIVRHIRIKKLELTCLCGAEDPASAALDYGKTCAVLYPFLGFIRASVTHTPKPFLTDVRCDFDRTSSLYEFDTVLSLRIFHAVWALLTLVIKNTAGKGGDR